METRVSFSGSDVWRWLTTGYLVLIPCLWWQGLTQDNVQVIAWHLGTFLLFAASLLVESRRTLKSPAFGLTLLAVLLPALLRTRTNGYPMLPIQAFMATVGVVCLVTKAPSSEWLIQRVRWLFWINVGYALLQRTGWDPLFQDTDAGMFSRSNQLTALLLVAVPFMGKAGRTVAAVGAVLYQSWTGMLGLLLWAGYRAFTRRCTQRWVWESLMLCSVAVTAVILTPSMWAMNVAPRIETWRNLIGFSLWSPLIGHGDTLRNFADGHLVSYFTYSVPFGAFYALGVLGIVALIALVAWMVRSRPSAQKEAALLFAWACLFQNLLDFPRMILLGCALTAALEIKNQELANES